MFVFVWCLALSTEFAGDIVFGIVAKADEVVLGKFKAEKSPAIVLMHKGWYNCYHVVLVYYICMCIVCTCVFVYMRVFVCMCMVYLFLCVYFFILLSGEASVYSGELNMPKISSWMMEKAGIEAITPESLQRKAQKVLYTHARTHTHTHTHTHMQVQVPTSIRTHHTHAPISHTHTHLYTHMHAHVHTHTRTHACTCRKKPRGRRQRRQCWKQRKRSNYNYI